MGQGNRSAAVLGEVLSPCMPGAWKGLPPACVSREWRSLSDSLSGERVGFLGEAISLISINKALGDAAYRSAVLLLGRVGGGEAFLPGAFTTWGGGGGYSVSGTLGT